MEQITESKMLSLLDSCYEKALEGIPMVSESIEELSKDYMSKYPSKEKAIDKLIINQIAKCGTNGFLTGLGGLITLPVTLPANITGVLYIQMRMIASIAYINGYDIKSDEVKTFVYLCLTGKSAVDIVKQVGIKVGTKLTQNVLKKLPGTVLIAINKAVGFRLVTKFGTKGAINLGKMVPLVGGVIGGGVDSISTKIMGDMAIKIFSND